jgi:hypothetical protein
MDTATLIETVAAPGQRLARALVTGVQGDTAVVLVPVDGGDPEAYRCDILSTGGPELALTPGDRVLVWCDDSRPQCGVVLGRVGGGARRASRTNAPRKEQPVPDTLVLEAKECVTIRVGDGSITIRSDGKILIKGRDLVSHAQRTNRIRGGSVAIN